MKDQETRLKELAERVRHLRDNGFEYRKNFVEPLFISAHNKFFYEAVDSKVVDSFENANVARNADNATNWTAFWAEDKENNDFLYPDMVLEWSKFWWFQRGDFIEWLNCRGIDRRKAVRMVKWRDDLIDYGGRRTKGGKRHQIYIIFCPVHAHKYLQKILKRFNNITTCAINGKTTNNLMAEAEINGHLDAWESMCRPYDEGNEHHKFIILMGGMGNRSLSVKRITYAILTGNNIGAASYDQKTSRIRTEWGLDKESVVLDMTLSHDGFSFNAKSLIDEYIRSKGGTVTQRQAFDIFAEGDNIVKYVCDADENGNYLQLFDYTDYNDYVRSISECQRLGDELNVILGSGAISGKDRNAIFDAAEQAIKYLGGEDKVKNEISYKPSSEAKGNFKTGNNQPTSANGSQQEAGKAKTQEEKKRLKIIQLIANIHKSLYKYPMSLVETVIGESNEKPLIARWESKKTYFYSAYATKYGETVNVILDILMQNNCQNSDWNDMILEKSKQHQNLLGMIA